MYLHVDHHSGEPISHQITAQIKWMIAGGRLVPGDKLPSIRALARELRINPTTVTRIYGELQHAGLITLRQGQGAFVAPSRSTLPPEEVKRVVAAKARTLLVEGIRLGLSRDQIDQIVDEEFDQMRSGSDG